MKEALKKYWGYDDFRPLQEEIIKDILQGKESLSLMPTGGGKSICYQLPAVLSEGGVLVVSPLEALIQDQVYGLNKRGIPSRGITSAFSDQENTEALEGFVSGRIKIIYIAPERLGQRIFLERLSTAKVSFVAVDEAHCICEWGYDFRPAYLNISKLREVLPGVCMVAFTATATPNVTPDICEKLGFRKPFNIRTSSFVRENIRYMIRETENAFLTMVGCLSSCSGSAIVYTRSRGEARKLSGLLLAEGISSEYYHAGRSAVDKASVQTDWLESRVRVMVATTAFGMGIDKPDVRYVFHWGIPETVESYFQEAGRAGRDGQAAYALLFLTRESVDKLFYPTENPPYDAKDLQRFYGQLFASWRLQGTQSAFYFHLDSFCQKHGYTLRQAAGMFRFMELQGGLRTTYEHAGTFRFLASEPRIRAWVSYRKEGFGLLDVLQRGFPQAFHQNQDLSEKNLADRLEVRVEDVIRQLKGLDRRKIIAYTPATSCAKITITHTEPSPYVVQTLIRSLSRSRDRDRKRRDDMYQFLRSSECRQVWLLRYFGQTCDPCGQCDVCIKTKKVPQNELIEKLQHVLRMKKNIYEVSAAMLPYDVHRVKEALRQSIKERRVKRENGAYINLDAHMK